MLFAQAVELAKEVAKELKSLNEIWGPSNTILICVVVLVIGLGVIAVVAMVKWAVPKLDRSYEAHMTWVSSLHAEIPMIKTGLSTIEVGLHSILKELKTQTDLTSQFSAKMEDLPSDLGNVCQLSEANLCLYRKDMLEAGYPEATVDRVIEGRKRNAAARNARAQGHKHKDDETERLQSQ